MIDLEEIIREIDKVEHTCDTTYRTCERLAMLYTVRNNLMKRNEDTRKTDYTRGSEFLDAASGVSYTGLMQVLDEHMSALAVVQPKQYSAILDKIRALRNN